MVSPLDPESTSSFPPSLTTPDYRVRIETTMGRPFIHMDVFRWTPRAARKFYRDFQQWFDTLGCPLFVAHHAQFGELQRKFIHKLGFIYLGPVVDYSGRPCTLYAKVK
jgi:hypothetical protein